MSLNALPQFHSLDTDAFVQHLDQLLETNLATIDRLLTQPDYTWDNLMQAMDDMDDALERFWSPMSHLHAVVNSPELRACYQACLPKLSAYESAIGQNQALYDAVKSIDPATLNEAQKKIREDSLRGFELSGVALSDEKKKRFEAIQTQLAELSNRFENNVLDATQAFTWHITDAAGVSGLPEHALQTARELAAEKELSGWMLNLETPCYLAVMTYADDRALRERFYEAYVTRASDQGPFAGQFDNSELINELLALRHETANMLGFAQYADLSLATKMADTPSQVLDFLMDLARRASGQAMADRNRLDDFARTEYALDVLRPWDVAYVSEKMRQRYYQLSQEDLRPYFTQDKVMDGLFTIINRLYGIRLEKMIGVDTWHPDVTCYRLLDEEDQERGFVYVDLFARQQKRGGAWMDSLQSRRRLPDGQVQLPIATLTCNFAKPATGGVATLSHDEVVTLFHEFGHCLHHLLTRVDYLGASGINGVEWDAVELPSQFFENWCWEFSALQLLSAHVETGEALPAGLYDKLLAAKNFQSAMGMMRQLEFSLFDFRIHHEYEAGKPNLVSDILSQVRQLTAVVPLVPYNRFQHSFSHIFAGGYGAGYYSYKWAEVLSSDAYARFEDEGIFNAQTGRDFLHAVLEVGGSRRAQDAFRAFRGRDAEVDALLRHNGIQP
ncbi:M3 family metallopeptidase [Legionella sp. CNM-4043-24]|uniref:M3 family metallopeptidase n=1 Tax=Legionella sp. CNM-4043-24 TaxID=3421646 RepID=UPI00403B19EB